MHRERDLGDHLACSLGDDRCAQDLPLADAPQHRARARENLDEAVGAACGQRPARSTSSSGR